MVTGFDKDILKESKKSADLLNKSARNIQFYKALKLTILYE